MPRSRRVPAALLAALLLPTVLSAPPARAADRHPSVVSGRPAPWTPHVLDGTVRAIAEVGGTVVVGGDFSRVTAADGGATLRRDNLFAFERGTGRISSAFAPGLDGEVLSLAPGPDGTVYVGGRFRAVDGERQSGITRLSVADGARIPEFTATLDGGWAGRVVEHAGRLYVGGRFSSVNGVRRTAVARLDAGTGAVDPDFDITLSHARSGPVRLQDLALSPDGRRLVVNGTFTVADGRRRYQIAVIDTSDRVARLSPWSTEAFTAACDHPDMHTYLRQMDFAPDGSYFVVVTTGGPDPARGLCKTATRWEATDRPDARPTWANHTGGDSLYSVAVTGAAVYVGGHQRWLNNEHAHKEQGPGAVERRGIGALDPVTGRALPWNPGRVRGIGVEALTATADGLYVGSDTEDLAGEYRGRLGMFPLAP
ncbi:delta-60 repeat domain-containing protein [Marinactinospora rubrisoli]|uniref:Delta-60 repeat domain-containing protein n=1 Tax=Marinactinospora rubrisoli TaxID=2715399 RepID=A0ABW2KJD2_9ACTN